MGVRLRPRHGVLTALALMAIGLLATLSWSEPTAATPVYSVRAGSACNTCHIEPIGWLDPDDHSRRECTLDCLACHVSKTGGALRNTTGEFFGKETLALFGHKPSEGANPEKYRRAPAGKQVRARRAVRAQHARLGVDLEPALGVE